jgi:hypothetical protein
MGELGVNGSNRGFSPWCTDATLFSEKPGGGRPVFLIPTGSGAARRCAELDGAQLRPVSLPYGKWRSSAL